ncbi:MAG TPA: hypothetical protein V6C89_01510 [Drouetiella sp.]|jgi:hypothetical protein
MRKTRNSKGSQLAEFPAAIILLILGVALPMIIMASVFYKVYMFNCVIKNGAQIGSTMQDFTSATNAAKAYLASQSPAGVSFNVPTVSLIQRTVSYTSSGNTQTYPAYFIQVTGTGSVPPLVRMHDFFGMSVPGLTGPMSLSSTQAVYFENQTAAASAYAGS